MQDSKRVKGAWLGNTVAMMDYLRIVNARTYSHGTAMIIKIVGSLALKST